MKLSQLKQIIKEEIQNSLKEAPKSSTLKDLDFKKLAKIFAIAEAPIPEFADDNDKPESISGGNPGGLKFQLNFLMRLSKRYAEGEKVFEKFIEKNDDPGLGMFYEDDVVNGLKDKNLANKLQTVEDALTSVQGAMEYTDPSEVIEAYNKLVDAVSQF
jgi:hypothetical protein